MASASSVGRQWRPADVAVLNQRFDGRAADALAEVLLRPEYGRVAVVSSFGAESAVLLHQVARVNRHIPVLFVSTGWLFPETLGYASDLARWLRLEDVRILEPDPAVLAAKDGQRLRWSYDPDGCCEIRKAAPLAAALVEFDCWISGRKREQAATRKSMQLFEADGAHLKLNPLVEWSAAALSAYAAEQALPPHPLVAEGYPSIGCSPCTSKVLPGEDPRAGRWRGWDKTECGIHKAPPPPGSDPVF
jgi:phosphoadenosine phosphosulfate reductase